MSRIVVGANGSPAAAEALRWAVEEERIRAVPVTAVLCWTFAGQHGPGGPTRFRADYHDADAHDALAKMVEQAVGPDDAAAVELVQVADFPVPGLVGQVSVGDLLVVGAGGSGARRGLLSGSVSQECVHRAPCPVAVLHAPAEGEVHPPSTAPRVVVGVDGSERSLRALRWALDEGRLRQVPVEVLHAWSVPARATYVPCDPIDLAGLEQRAARLLDQALGQRNPALDEQVVPVLVHDDPAEALLSRAEGAAVVVLGSKGLGGITGFLLGSVAHRVSHLAPCPVVLVPDIDVVT